MWPLFVNVILESICIFLIHLGIIFMSWIGSMVVIERVEFVYLKNEVSYFVKYKTIGLFLFGVITYVD